MIDAKRNLVKATREMILDSSGISWFCLNTRNEKSERLYSDGVYTLTKEGIKSLEDNDIPNEIDETDAWFINP